MLPPSPAHTPEFSPLGFMMSSNAIVTFRSKAKDNRFTYRIRASEDGGVHFVAVLRGADNNSDYSYLGYIRRDVFLYMAGGEVMSYLMRHRPCVLVGVEAVAAMDTIMRSRAWPRRSLWFAVGDVFDCAELDCVGHWARVRNAGVIAPYE